MEVKGINERFNLQSLLNPEHKLCATLYFVYVWVYLGPSLPTRIEKPEITYKNTIIIPNESVNVCLKKVLWLEKIYLAQF